MMWLGGGEKTEGALRKEEGWAQEERLVIRGLDGAKEGSESEQSPG